MCDAQERGTRDLGTESDSKSDRADRYVMVLPLRRPEVNEKLMSREVEKIFKLQLRTRKWKDRYISCESQSRSQSLRYPYPAEREGFWECLFSLRKQPSFLIFPPGPARVAPAFMLLSENYALSHRNYAT